MEETQVYSVSGVLGKVTSQSPSHALPLLS